MSWQQALILNPGEHVLHSWKGDCERRKKELIEKRGLIRKKYEEKEAKQLTSGVLVLTNQRLIWLERRGKLSKTYRASFEINLKELLGITAGGAIRKWISITDRAGESIFHLNKVGKKEIEPFRDMIMRQVEKLREAEVAPAAPTVQKEVVTREVVMVPCKYCGGLMPQTSTFCPNCGAKRT